MPSALEKQARSELQKTSIVVGYDALNYSTTNKDMDAMSTSRHLKFDNNLTMKKIKEEHQGRHYDVGDANEKPLTYETTSKLQDPTGEMEKYTAKLNLDARAMLMRTSAIVGYDKPQYDTSTRGATQWNREDMRPKKCPFVYGDDPPSYESTAKGTMNFDQKDAKCAVMAADVKEDLRKCHYSFGNDKVDYTTSSHIPSMPTEVFKEMTKKHVPINDPRKTSVYFS